MSGPDLHDPDDHDGGGWQKLTTEQTLALIKTGRRDMLLMAIEVLESVTPQRAMEAGLEVLRAALADLDRWADGWR